MQNPTRFLPILLLLLPLAGCSEDLLNPGGETLIEGRVVLSPAADPSSPPVFGIGLGVVYLPVQASSAPTPAAPAQARGVVLGNPYPNPLTDPDGTPARIRVTAEAAVAGRVEVWADSREFRFPVAVLEEETLAAGETVHIWDGTDATTGDRLPNGLYFARVTLADDTVLEAPIVLNRSVVDVIALGAFNTWSDPDGAFLIPDIAVGERFRAAAADGTDLGPRVLAERVTLFPDDVNFEHQEEAVDIAPREVVRVILELLPRKPAPPPLALPGANAPRTGIHP